MGVEENVLSAGFERTREMYRECVAERRGLSTKEGEKLREKERQRQKPGRPIIIASFGYHASICLHKK
jgi:hypothetical protein